MSCLHLLDNFVFAEGAVPDADFVNEPEEFALSFMCFPDEDASGILEPR